MIVQTKFLNCTTTGRLLNVEILWLSFQQKGVNALVLAQKGGSKIHNAILRYDMAMLLGAEFVKARIITF